jgi:hypothetical protein
MSLATARPMKDSFSRSMALAMSWIPGASKDVAIDD